MKKTLTKKRIELVKIEFQSDYELVSAQFNFDNSMVILETPAVPKRIDNQFVPKITKGLLWRVKWAEYDIWHSFECYHPTLNFTFVQKIDSQHFLLVASRAQRADTNNACIYTIDGQLISSFAVGDGIESVAVTEEGEVWLSYFDEGVMGSSELGQHGVVKVDLQGNLLWTAQEFDIVDCYAMNVDSQHSCWFYYYTDFQLVHVDRDSITTYKPKIDGANAFAVLGNYLLLQNGYSDRNKFTLFEIIGKQLSKRYLISFTDNMGKSFTKAGYVMRGSQVLLITEAGIYYKHLSYADLIS